MIIKDNQVEKDSNYSTFKFIASSLQSGLFGFAIFFTVLLVSKFLSSLIGTNEVFKIDFSDVTLSLIGFVLTFLISFLKHFSQSNEKQDPVKRHLKGKTP